MAATPSTERQSGQEQAQDTPLRTVPAPAAPSQTGARAFPGTGYGPRPAQGETRDRTTGPRPDPGAGAPAGHRGPRPAFPRADGAPQRDGLQRRGHDAAGLR